MLQIECFLDEWRYGLVVHNARMEPVNYWVVPLDKDRSEFKKVPFGAEIFVRSDDGFYNKEEGYSSLVLAAELLLPPVRLESIQPGKTRLYKFHLKELMRGLIFEEISQLRKRGTEYRIEMKVYLDEKLKEFVSCSSDWHPF